MDYLEAVMELKGIVNNTFIEKIIPLIDKKANQNLAIGGAGDVETNVRNVKGYNLDLKTPTNIFYWNYIKKEIERLYAHYKIKFPKMMSNKINQIDLLKYSVGGKYNIHNDYYTLAQRHLSVIINLNDNYEGGDLVFFDQKNVEVKRLNLIKGSIVFFPSNFMYPHMIEPIKKGTRYSIVAWLQ
tara:strand:- start:2576 stop:3127 length:552 start_codon:yes stop_codon:yes gene_type:complete